MDDWEKVTVGDGTLMRARFRLEVGRFNSDMITDRAEINGATTRIKSMNEGEITGAAKDVFGKVKDGVGGLTGDSSLQIDGKIDQASGKIQSMFGDAKDRLGDAASATADKASKFADRAGATLHDATETVRQGAGQAAETVADVSVGAGQQVGRAVQDQPLLSLIGAAAIGYAIGFLIHSSMSPLAPEPKTRRYLR